MADKKQEGSLYTLQVKYEAIRLVLVVLLQIRSKEDKQGLSRLATIIQAEFVARPPGTSDEEYQHRQNVAAAFAEIFRLGTSKTLSSKLDNTVVN